MSAADSAHWRLESIGRFNEAGDATAYALFDGQWRAALVHLSAPVPEPGAMVLLAVALPRVGGAVARGRRRRGARDGLPASAGATPGAAVATVAAVSAART